MRIALLIAAVSAATTGAFAQDVCVGKAPRVPDYGYGFVSCHGCLRTVVRKEETITAFSGEPALYQIRASGPGAGKIVEGDTLVAVDDRAITTNDAAWTLATFHGAGVKFTLRRNGVLKTVTIKPEFRCAQGAIVDVEKGILAQSLERMAGQVRAERTDVRGIVTTEMLMDTVRIVSPGEIIVLAQQDTTRRIGVLGVGISCERCGVERLADGRVRWSFEEFPVIVAVEPKSLAEQLRVQPGDVLESIDGLSLTSREGGERLGLAPVGLNTRISFRRGPALHHAAINYGVPFDVPRLTKEVGKSVVDVYGKNTSWITDPNTGEIRISFPGGAVIVRPAKQ